MRSNTTALTPFSRWNASPVRRNFAPLPRQHLARRDDDCLLMVGIKMGLDRIADDDDGAVPQARGGRAVDLVDVRHRDARLTPHVARSGWSCHNSSMSWPLNV